MHIVLKSLIFLSAALGLAGYAYCSGNEAPAVQHLSYGVSQVTLTADGVPGMAVFAHRENFNAHGFDVLTLYLNALNGVGSSPIWQIVPIFDKNKERLLMTVSGGADCLLHDFRLLAPLNRERAKLVVADRDMGENYAVEASVTFRFYELQKNADGIPGEPLYYFKLTRSARSQHPYCDVGEALSRELGLGQYMERPQ